MESEQRFFFTFQMFPEIVRNGGLIYRDILHIYRSS